MDQAEIVPNTGLLVATLAQKLALIYFDIKVIGATVC